MSTSPPTPWSRGEAPAALIRCLIMSLTSAMGFWGLGALAHLERMSAGMFQADPEMIRLGGVVAGHAAMVMTGVALINENMIWLLSVARVRSSTAIFCASVLPAVVGGVLFLSDDLGPRRLMLIAGGSLVGYLAGAVQALLTHSAGSSDSLDTRAGPTKSSSGSMGEGKGHLDSARGMDSSTELIHSFQPPISMLWYGGLVLLTAMFFGGMRGWADDSPYVSQLLEYHRQRWNAPSTPLPEPREESVPFH